jgi:lysophospholipase L1-like esterase
VVPVLALLLCVAGCGGSSPDDQAPRPERGKTLVAALGDSITAGSPLWDPDPAVREQIGEALDPESQYEHWAQLRLEGLRFRNCGVFGERTDEIAARLDRCSRGAEVLVVQGGINDIAQGVPAERAADNLRRMAERGRRRGLRVALTEVLPWNNGHPRADRPIRRLNALIRGIGKQLRVPVFGWYRRLEDPKAPGRMRRELTDDGDHPSVAGYRALAEDVELP